MVVKIFTSALKNPQLRRAPPLKPTGPLIPLVKVTEELHNPYGVMVVNPDKNDKINVQGAQRFVDFLISEQAQKAIRDFRIQGEPLFKPLLLKSDA